MFRTFQFRLRPNVAQLSALNHVLVDSCETYNAALQERRDAWKLQRKSISYRNQQDQITELRKDPIFKIVACDIQRDPLRRVDRAFKDFFRRCKTGQKPGFPRFKKLARYDSFSFGGALVVRDRSIRIPNVGNIRARGGRPIEGRAKFCTIKRCGKHWVASVVCDVGPASVKRIVSLSVGIDVGLTTLCTLSDGQSIENPRWIRKHEARIAAANRKLALKLKRSRNRTAALEVLRRSHQRASNARVNYIHHISKWLVANYDLIAHENLKIANMIRSNLAKSILDAAWNILIGQITYKAEKAGVWVIPVSPRGTSILCSGCGTPVQKTLADRQHNCVCGVSLNRDHNAALNIKRLGMSLAGLKPSQSILDPVGDLCI